MSWPHGPSQNHGTPTSSFGQNASSSQQTKRDGQGNRSNRGFPLYIVNVPVDFSEEQLNEMFSKAGTVSSTKCLPPKDGRNSTVGFVTYNTEEDAQNAISMFNNVQINRMTLKVDYTRSFKEERSQNESTGNEGSPFSSGYQKDTKNPFSYQSTNLHSIGRGVHYDNGSENQFSSIGRGIHFVTPQEVTNGYVQGSFNQVPGQATNNGFEEASWEAPHANTNGLQEPSNTFAKQSDHGNAGPGMQSCPMDAQAPALNSVKDDPSFVTYNNPQTQGDQESPYPTGTSVQSSYSTGNPVPSPYSTGAQVQSPYPTGTEVPQSFGDYSYGNAPQNLQSPYSSQAQEPQTTVQGGDPSFGNYNYEQNVQENTQLLPSGHEIPPSSTTQGYQSNQPDVDGLVNGFGSMQVTQPATNQSFGSNHSFGSNQPFGSNQSFGSNQPSDSNQYFGSNQTFGSNQPSGSNQSFGSNQYQVSSRLPRSQAGSGERTCHKCGEAGHFSRECPNSSGGDRGGCHSCGEQGHFARECPKGSSGGSRGGGGNCHQCGQPGHFSRECPNKTDGRQGGGCHKCGEQGHFARECPNSSAGAWGGGNCHRCGEPGHFSRECPNQSERGQGGACHTCGEQGHFSRECPRGGQEEEGLIRPPRVDYVPPPLPEDVDLLFKATVHKGINFDRFDNIPVEVTGNNPPAPIQTFDELLLPDTLKSNLGKAEFTKPTPVQKHGIPIVLSGRDIMACAQTGSGKTVAFLLPVMAGMVNSRLPEASYMGGDAASPAALCIAPTRELAYQIYMEALKFSSGTYLRPVVCYGGVSVQHQLQSLERGCHILICTPGRLLDFVGRNRVSLTNVRYLILDEADRMLDMGFENDIRKIVTQLGMPEKIQRQTLMFSATFPDEIQKLAREFLNDYLFLAVGSIGGSNLDIKQEILDLQTGQKRNSLLEIIGQSGKDKTLVFVERKRNADFLASWLSQNQYPATSISGDRTQKEREDALRDFRDGRATILIATSVAARGLDIPDVKHVINYDMPQQIEEYVHRIGRTGRIGNQGRATAFFERGKDDKLARSLVKVLSDALQDVPNWLEEVAERALGTSYGPAGGKFSSRDTRQFGRRSGDGRGGDGNSQSTNVSFMNHSMPQTQTNVDNGDEEEWA